MSERSAISLFTGAGGLDLGLEAAGFQTRVGVEFDPIAATTAAEHGWNVICDDIHAVASESLLRSAELGEGEAALLVGGPPCQPFSKSGYWASGDARRLDDPRADTLVAYMRVLRDTLPEVFVLENVHGINYSGKEEGLLFLQDAVEEINRERGVNYTLAWSVLNAVEYGVPQRRTRFFMVGHRGGRTFSFPKPTHGEGREPFVTAWDAIGGLEPDHSENLRARGRWAQLLPSIPEGENYLWHTDRKGGEPLFGWRTRFWNFLLKLAKDQPAWTIQAQPGPSVGPFHWNSRYLSTRELARLQTFPDHVQFAGNRRAVQRQIGNAVPALLAETIGRAVRHQLLEDGGSLVPTLAIPYRRPIPSAEAVVPVPDEYLVLRGSHSAHPGTGRGPGSAVANAAD